MEEQEKKHRLEQYRLQQFSAPHAAIQAGAYAQPGSLLEAAPVVDQKPRVVIHVDSDSFCKPGYCSHRPQHAAAAHLAHAADAQVEELRDPSLRTKPLGECAHAIQPAAHWSPRL